MALDRHVPSQYATHYPDIFGFPLHYTNADQFYARGVCKPPLVEDKHYGLHAHTTTAQQLDGLRCAVQRDY